MQRRKQPITTRSYDMTGHTIWRALRQELIFRILPFGSFGGGPNLFFVARLIVLHAVGGLMARAGSRCGWMMNIVMRLAGRMR